jgi:hypothetical protein
MVAVDGVGEVGKALLAHPLVAGAAHGGRVIPGNCATAKLMRKAGTLLAPAKGALFWLGEDGDE